MISLLRQILKYVWVSKKIWMIPIILLLLTLGGILILAEGTAFAPFIYAIFLAAAQEERFSRNKGDSNFPSKAIAFCLDKTGLSVDELDFVAFYDKPLLTFDRLLETYLAFAPRGLPSFRKSIPIWVKEKLLLQTLIRKQIENLGRGTLPEKKLLFGFHHHSHAAAAFYPSPFESAAILVMDGVGEWATASLGRGAGTEVTLLSEIRFPHSLGMLYSAFTYYLGFKVNEGEYKMMGLAPYGEPKYLQKIRDNLIDIKEDGSFRLNMKYFNYCTGLTMTNQYFDELFDGIPPRKSSARLSQRDMNIACSVQAVTEDIVLRLVRTLKKETNERNLCMAGGVALNCVANGRVLREGPFANLWIQPAAGDSGSALGVALAVTHLKGQPRIKLNGLRDGMKGTYLGPDFAVNDIEATLSRHGAVYHEFSDDELFDRVAQALASENVVGWFQGRMEFGPRALGNRSILGDARSSRMQSMLNMKIKYRESFRPFAPAVLDERMADYFGLESASPYMLLVDFVRPDRRLELTAEDSGLEGIDRLQINRSDIPSVTHVDYSARIQTVHKDTNPRFYRLLKSFYEQTGYGLLVNTSFNIRDEPIVCTPEDAYRCFMGTEMDLLVLGNTVLVKEEQA